MATKIGPARPILAAKGVWGTNFGKIFCQNLSGQTDFREDRFWHDSATIRFKYITVVRIVELRNLGEANA